MAKPTGFMDYSRAQAPDRIAKERIADYQWIHTQLSPAARKEQAGRCMNCGVPFCQTPTVFGNQAVGCPLHNQIPEWNQQLWEENLPVALERLLRTNCFPEFTGYVCPALCERACNCNKVNTAVSVNDNERYIIDEAFDQGLMQPNIPQHRSGKQVAVVGSGPAGLTVATLLNQHGHSVTVYERDSRPGGLLVYGIPNMKLPKEVVARRIAFMEKEGVTFRCNVNVGGPNGPSAEELAADFDAVVLAVGAQEPRRVPYEKDAAGIMYALDFLHAAACDQLKEAPLSPGLCAAGKTVAIVGAGDTANDCIATALRQGATNLVQLIRRPAADYGPMTDYAHEEAAAVFNQDIRRFGTQVSKVIADEQGNLAQLVLSTPEGDQTINAQMLVIASGFTGAEAYSLAEGNNLFQAGDMATGATLVVRAMAHARNVAAAVDTFLVGYTNINHS